MTIRYKSGYRSRSFQDRELTPPVILVECPKCNQQLVLSGMGMHSHFKSHINKKELTYEEATAMRIQLGDTRVKRR